ncbi:hypothetical protein BJX96DRAFT_149766 [Aspergillus floccosus]
MRKFGGFIVRPIWSTRIRHITEPWPRYLHFSSGTFLCKKADRSDTCKSMYASEDWSMWKIFIQSILEHR